MKNHQKFLLQMKKKLEISTEKPTESAFSTPEKAIPTIEKTTTAEIQPAIAAIVTGKQIGRAHV